MSVHARMHAAFMHACMCTARGWMDATAPLGTHGLHACPCSDIDIDTGVHACVCACREPMHVSALARAQPQHCWQAGICVIATMATEPLMAITLRANRCMCA